ncbi:hypothetical protein ASF49_00840 [Methylobacterium sp. Leaf104]|uniref:hypothetical protein n=1 Tax=Methylobacterium TaxID=407 RepID=UPI0006FE594B|nr:MULTISPECIES: hypothetical protein [Methylobacterium]KQP42437.1 hypothetical protein ASF49_00840 [Methylobacterium sp. Leaf104]MCI9879034.1 hypothetical protein [Methylobacterium goesingense]
MTFRDLLRTSAAPALLLAFVASAAAQEAPTVTERHASWRACLNRNFALEVALSSRVIAADAALRACRPSEQAYLTALSASPLVDGDDVARVRPALLLRARGWLLDGGRQRPL